MAKDGDVGNPNPINYSFESGKHRAFLEGFPNHVFVYMYNILSADLLQQHQVFLIVAVYYVGISCNKD